MSIRFDQRKTVCFDLETIADPDTIPFLPEVSANGRLADPRKIAADIAEKEAEQVGKMGLSPWHSYIAAFGWKSLDNEGVILLDDATPEAESDLLINAWEVLGKFENFITFNGLHFDAPFMSAHSLRRGVTPEVRIDCQKYRVTNHLDVRAVLTGWEQYAKGNLDYWCRMLLGHSPKVDGMDGSQVQTLWDQGRKEEIGTYCLGDVRHTWELGIKVNQYYMF